MDRTLQSTYSELLGLYPPNHESAPRKVKLGEEAMNRAIPPMKVRQVDSLIQQTSGELFLDSYNQVPVYSYLSKNTPSDDIQPGGCNYAFTFNNDHWNKEQTYDGVSDFILPSLKLAVGRAFGLSQEDSKAMTFVQLYSYSDVLLAENMEGDKPRYSFTPQ